MDEVWKEIDLSSLLDHSSRHAGDAVDPTGVNSFHPGCDVSLQDFLARPFHKVQEPALFPSPRRRSPPESLLGLASCNRAAPPQQQQQKTTRGLTQAAASVPSKAVVVVSPEKGVDEEEQPEQRRKRLMKCRESAARTRAKKQAHMSELEMELNHLQQENAKLKWQYLELRMAVSALAPVKQQRHRRTLTAPF